MEKVSIAMHIWLRRRNAVLALLVSGLVSGMTVVTPTASVSAQASGGQEDPPAIEDLEKTALNKLRESHKAIKNKMDFLVTTLARGGPEADEARRRLVDIGRYVLADNRTVAEHLVSALLETKNSRQRSELVLVLQRLGDTLRERKKTALPPLLEAARMHDHRLPAVVEVLIAMNLPEACAALSPLLDHESPRVRVAILRLVGIVGDQDAGARVAKALQAPDRDVQLAAIQALTHLNCAGAVAQIIPLMRVNEERVFSAAVDAIAHFQAKEAIPELLDLLKKSSEASRTSRLITALGEIGPATKVAVQASVEKALRGYLTAKRETLVKAAGFALVKLGKISSEVERALTRDLRDELTRDPRNFIARRELAHTLKKLADLSGSKSYYTKAIKEYKTIIKESKRNSVYLLITYIELAGCHARMEQFKSAARYLDKVPRHQRDQLRYNVQNSPDFAEMRKDSQYKRFFE